MKPEIFYPVVLLAPFMFGAPCTSNGDAAPKDQVALVDSSSTKSIAPGPPSASADVDANATLFLIDYWGPNPAGGLSFVGLYLPPSTRGWSGQYPNAGCGLVRNRYLD